MVAFGVHLQRNRAVEWSSHYVRYEHLKQQVSRIKEARERHRLALEGANAGETDGTTGTRRRHGRVNTTDEEEKSGSNSAHESDVDAPVPSHRQVSHEGDDEGEDGMMTDRRTAAAAASSSSFPVPIPSSSKPSVVDRVRVALSEAIGRNLAKDAAATATTAEDAPSSEDEIDEAKATPLRVALTQAYRNGVRQHAEDLSKEQRKLERAFARSLNEDAEKVDEWFTQQLAFFIRQFAMLQKQFHTLRAADQEAEAKIREAHHHVVSKGDEADPAAVQDLEERKMNQLQRYSNRYGGISEDGENEDEGHASGSGAEDTVGPMPHMSLEITSPERPLAFGLDDRALLGTPGFSPSATPALSATPVGEFTLTPVASLESAGSPAGEFTLTDTAAVSDGTSTADGRPMFRSVGASSAPIRRSSFLSVVRAAVASKAAADAVGTANASAVSDVPSSAIPPLHPLSSRTNSGSPLPLSHDTALDISAATVLPPRSRSTSPPQGDLPMLVSFQPPPLLPPSRPKRLSAAEEWRIRLEQEDHADGEDDGHHELLSVASLERAKASPPTSPSHSPPPLSGMAAVPPHFGEHLSVDGLGYRASTSPSPQSVPSASPPSISPSPSPTPPPLAGLARPGILKPRAPAAAASASSGRSQQARGIGFLVPRAASSSPPLLRAAGTESPPLRPSRSAEPESHRPPGGWVVLRSHLSLAPTTTSAGSKDDHHLDHKGQSLLSRVASTSRAGLMKRAKQVSLLASKGGHELTESASHLHENAQLQLRLLKSRTPWRTLRAAFKELYRGLQLLRDFKTLNYTAFCKILKKHDKESIRIPLYSSISRQLDALNCFFSPQPLTLMVEMEEFFIRGFSRGNRKAGLAALRPQVAQLSYLVTFRLGFLLGLIVCLFMLLVVLIHFVSISSSQSVSDQLSPVLPIYRGLGLVILHLWLWGCNVYFFHEKRINYMFIFEIDSRSELQYSQVLQIAALLTFGWFLSLDLYMSTTLLKASYYPNLQQGYFHLVLYLIIFCIALCPFNILARPTRLYVAKTLWAIVTTGWGPVAFKDFYTCNQLTSLVNVFNDLSYGLCFYFTGDFLTVSPSRCKAFQSDAIWIIAFIPYWFRFIQCLKRYKDSKAKRQLYNALKYSMSLMTTFWSLMHKHYPSGTYLPFWICSAICSTTYSYIWDVKCDWNLLEFHPDSKKKDKPKEIAGGSEKKKKKKGFLARLKPSWFPSTDSLLRRHRVLDWSGFYFWAIISDGAMRLAWVATISPDVITGGVIPTDYFKTIIYCVEVLRRNQWNFFRLENEHLGNVEKEKVVNIIPLAATKEKPKNSAEAAAAKEAAIREALSDVSHGSTDFEAPKARQQKPLTVRDYMKRGIRMDQSSRSSVMCPRCCLTCGERLMRRLSKIGAWCENVSSWCAKKTELQETDQQHI